MRAQAMEKLMVLMEKAIDQERYDVMPSLAQKSRILRNREPNVSAAVVRELINDQVKF